MGKIILMENTTKNPISLIGEVSGICYNSDTEHTEKNYKRGLHNLKSGHGRTFEYPQVYMILDGYSARVIREFYTHIGGAPSRLQSSTRYINYGDFDYIVPPSVNTIEKTEIYNSVMNEIKESFCKLQELGVPKEDIANILPFGMETKVVVRTNLRNLMDMAEQRLCGRAYWEYRRLMKDIMDSLSDYSEEWKYLIENHFKCKCDKLGYCPEEKSCGRFSDKAFEEKWRKKLLDIGISVNS